MNRITNVWLMIIVVVGVFAGYATNPSSRIRAQQESRGSLPPPPVWNSRRPAPYLHSGNLTMWPNQPIDGTHWSIDDIKRAHQIMADAEKAGKAVQPNSTLHDFPYWTRTHSMFIYHTPLHAKGNTAEQHMGYSQFIVIMGGTGTVQAGGTLQNGTILQEKGAPIWGEIRGSAVSGGVTFNLKEGDWVSIPPNMPAHFKANAPGGLSYMVMKVNAGLYPWELIR
jgi:quercetin dioxygenase-like cupin family protein